MDVFFVVVLFESETSGMFHLPATSASVCILICTHTHIYMCVCVLYMGFLDGSKVKNLPAVPVTSVRSLCQKEPLEKGVATHSSTLAWRIPWMEEADGLYSPWGHKESDTALCVCMYVCVCVCV